MEAADDFVSWYEAEHARTRAALTLACGSSERATDAVDEAFARALERWSRVRQMHSRTGWVYRVALNVVRRQARRAALERRLVNRGDALPSLDPPTADPQLWAAVRELPPRQRVAIALRYVADLTEPQIADAMDIAPGTVAASLNSARKRLAAMLATREEHIND